MELPRIIVNFKAYREATGERAIEIAKAAEDVWKETGVSIGVAPQAVDLRRVAEAVEIPVFAQHVDPYEPGARTGSVTPYAARDAGAYGTLLNHSERRLRIDQIEMALSLARRYGLKVVVCANDPIVGRAVSELGPDAVAVEPPELIGTGISVSKAKPEVVLRSVEVIEGIVYVGAGVSTGEDVRRSLELGAYGVLLASAVAKSEDPKSKLLELAEAVLTFE